jgi:hypothetical protein
VVWGVNENVGLILSQGFGSNGNWFTYVDLNPLFGADAVEVLNIRMINGNASGNARAENHTYGWAYAWLDGDNIVVKWDGIIGGAGQSTLSFQLGRTAAALDRDTNGGAPGQIRYLNFIPENNVYSTPVGQNRFLILRTNQTEYFSPAWHTL